MNIREVWKKKWKRNRRRRKRKEKSDNEQDVDIRYIRFGKKKNAKTTELDVIRNENEAARFGEEGSGVGVVERDREESGV